MENVICTVVQEKTAEEFISFLNKYGVCTDYSNDYERSKAIQGIFVGVVNKVYDVVWKGEGGHSEHDTLFMSAKSLMSSRRESQPFRVGFVGNIVSQLIEVNLKEGDAIGILKPKFFYALDIPTLCAGVGNVVVWVAKNLNGSEVQEDATKSSDENQYFQSLKKQRNGPADNRKRIPFIDEDSDTHSLGGSSVSGSLGHDIQIFRSRPVVLKKSQASTNNILVPDSTTRTVVQTSQNNLFSTKNRAPENALADNIVSQNTANVGSATELSCRSEHQCNLDSAVKFVHNDSCYSCHNVANSRCGIHSCAASCRTKCCCSRTNCCPCHVTTANQYKENSSSCNYRPPCACFNNQHCPCTRNSCCGHNALSNCVHWNSAHSCRTDNSSCKKHFDHHCKPILSCCMPCHARINQCCFSHFQNGCLQSKCFHRQTGSDERGTLCCNEQITAHGHCHNLCSCNHQKINISENSRALPCYASRKEGRNNSNEEMSTELSEESHKKSRTKEWVHNWVGEPPHLLPDSEPSERLGTCSTNPSLESRPSVVKDGTTCNEPMETHLNLSEPADCVFKKITQKNIIKKKKLFNILDTSIISAKTVYGNSTIVEESTPFDSENHTDTPHDSGLPSDKNQEPKEKNVDKDINLDLPLSNNSNLNNTPNATSKDPSPAKETNCNESADEGKTNKDDLKLQNKETLSENINSSDEPFPSLQIETPVISETCTESRNDGNKDEMSNKTNQCESKMIDYVEASCSKDSLNTNHKESTFVEKICDGDNEEILFKKASNHDHDGKNDNTGKSDSTAKNDNTCKNDNPKSNEGDDIQIITVLNKSNEDRSPNRSLALQNHSKSSELSNTKEIDSRMEFTLVCDNTIDKEGMKRSKESSDDAMELTCESTLMKRRKKEKFRKTRSVGSLSSGRNINEVSVSSADSFYDAHSDGILSLRANKWCLKPIKEVFDKPNFLFNRKVIEGLTSKSGTSYNLNLFSTFSVIGAIINVLPSLSEENFGNLVEGFCNEGCRTKYTYEDYKKMQPVSTQCTFCRYNHHLACPGCSKSGSEKPLCLYYNFEIHLFDGENVLRVEVDHKSGVDFLGCTPQYYLHSTTIYKKINKIIFPITDDTRKDPVLLKAKIKVKPKSGASVLMLENTTLRKDLMLKGKNYKL